MKTPDLRKSIGLSPLRLAFFLLPLAFFALSPHARAVCQDGCGTNNNTFLGDSALISNTGTDNTAIGFQALLSNTTGTQNTAIGSQALGGNLSTQNTAIGFLALGGNIGGSENVANGVGALYNGGSNNTACGLFALYYNTGNYNTADGNEALFSNTTGHNNIALGANAGSYLTTGNSNIDVGNHGIAGESKTIRIGNQLAQTKTFIAGISGATVPTGVAVIVDSSGHLGTTTSSARLKEAIQPMDKASEAILGLKPVTFRYKKDLDPDGIPQFGLVAEEVDKVNPDLVARDEQGKPYTVRYEAVNAMLLNEFLKEHRKVEELEAKLAKQEKDFSARLKEQDAKIQKVSDELEVSKSPPQTVVTNQ